MRLTLTVGGLTIVDLRILEADEEEQGIALDSSAELDGGDAPFGFRPGVDPLPFEHR